VGPLRSMKPAIFPIVILFHFWLAGAVDAQPAELDSVGGQAGSAPTLPPGQEKPDIAPTSADLPSMCQVVASAAAANGLPIVFFARVIWQESRFKSDALGPVTRSGQRAQGIAQFMPMTAEERLLHDPFDPVQALPKSAEFLRDLRAQFGNLGLAAAAYNAGPQRVRDWLAGKRTLPSQTQAYVRIVTGRSVEEWARSAEGFLTVTVPQDMSCAETTKLVSKPQSPPTVAQPKQTPAWVVQLVGDKSETRALTLYRRLVRKHEALLKNYEPVFIRTTVGVGTVSIWTRIRIDANNRQAAEILCSTIRATGDDCLVQRN
jgi:hypothetical protein